MINIFSVLSFRKLTDKKIKHHKQKILNLIKKESMVTSRKISKKLNIPINIISARINELKSENKIYCVGKLYDEETKRYVSSWTLI